MRFRRARLPCPCRYSAAKPANLCGVRLRACPQVRMVAQEHLNRYTSSFDCARQLLQAEGPKGLFIGLGPTLWRVTTWNTLYYGVGNRGARLVVGERCSVPKTDCEY